MMRRPAMPARVRERLGNEAVGFAVLRGVTLIAGLAALLIEPLRPEHEIHLAPLLAAFVVYNAALVALLARWTEEARAFFLATLGADLAIVFVLVWFTGGGGSHFYLLFYPLVALNAYYFGARVGVVAAALASGLLAAANWLAATPELWSTVGARAMLLGLVGLPLGYIASRERAERARAERLKLEMDEAKRELARAEQLAAIGRLSSRIAHEVRNPLGAINLNVELLGDLLRDVQNPAGTEAREILETIRGEVHALAELTDDYLLAARLQRPWLERNSVNALVEDLVTSHRAVAAQAGVKIAAACDPTLPPVPFDRAMVRLALRNLIKNGIEVLRDGGEIVVETKREGDDAVIAVADNGPGIAPDAAGRLFEPFFTTKPGGTGLGLSIAQEIARGHGNEMTWVSVPGQGARFTIRIPIGATADG